MGVRRLESMPVAILLQAVFTTILVIASLPPMKAKKATKATKAMKATKAIKATKAMSGSVVMKAMKDKKAMKATTKMIRGSVVMKAMKATKAMSDLVATTSMEASTNDCGRRLAKHLKAHKDDDWKIWSTTWQNPENGKRWELRGLWLTKLTTSECWRPMPVGGGTTKLQKKQ